MLRSTWSDRDWGLMLMRLMPASRKARSFSWVMVSGRPASTVNSPQREKSNTWRIFPHRAESCRALRVVGVPPPMYTDTKESPRSFVTWATFSISSKSSWK